MLINLCIPFEKLNVFSITFYFHDALMRNFIRVQKDLRIYIYSIYVYMGVLLPDRQTLRGDSRHEDKHY